jgi:hypothetical protein
LNSRRTWGGTRASMSRLWGNDRPGGYAAIRVISLRYQRAIEAISP